MPQKGPTTCQDEEGEEKDEGEQDQEVEEGADKDQEVDVITHHKHYQQQ